MAARTKPVSKARPRRRTSPVAVMRDWVGSMDGLVRHLNVRLDAVQQALMTAEANGRRLDILAASLQRRIDALETEFIDHAVRLEQERDREMAAERRPLSSVA